MKKIILWLLLIPAIGWGIEQPFKIKDSQVDYNFNIVFNQAQDKKFDIELTSAISASKGNNGNIKLADDGSYYYLFGKQDNAWRGVGLSSTPIKVDGAGYIHANGVVWGDESVSTTSASGGVTDHNALLNLTVENPHTQYFWKYGNTISSHTILGYYNATGTDCKYSMYYGTCANITNYLSQVTTGFNLITTPRYYGHIYIGNGTGEYGNQDPYIYWDCENRRINTFANGGFYMANNLYFTYGGSSVGGIYSPNTLNMAGNINLYGYGLVTTNARLDDEGSGGLAIRNAADDSYMTLKTSGLKLHYEGDVVEQLSFYTGADVLQIGLNGSYDSDAPVYATLKLGYGTGYTGNLGISPAYSTVSNGNNKAFYFREGAAFNNFRWVFQSGGYGNYRNYIEISTTSFKSFVPIISTYTAVISSINVAQINFDDGSNLRSNTTLMLSTTQHAGDVTGTFDAIVVGSDTHLHSLASVDISTVSTYLNNVALSTGNFVLKTGDTMTGMLTETANLVVLGSTTLNGEVVLGTDTLRTYNSKIGIGTPTPTYKLELSSAGTKIGATNMYLLSTYHNNTGDNQGIFLGYESTGGGIIGAATNATGQPIEFWTFTGSAWGERMRITKTGYVGIGSNSPKARLEVNNTAASTAVQLQVSTGTTNLFEVTGTSTTVNTKLYTQNYGIVLSTNGSTAVPATDTPSDLAILKTFYVAGLPVLHYSTGTVVGSWYPLFTLP